MRAQTVKRIAAVLGLLLLVWCTEKVVEYFVLPLNNVTRAIINDRRELDGTITNMFVGGSLVRDGIDPQIMDAKLGGVTFNFGTNGQIMSLTRHLVADAIDTNPLENVFIEVSVRRMIKEPDVALGVGRLAFIEYMNSPRAKLNFIREEFTIDDFPGLFAESARCQLKFLIANPRARFSLDYLRQYLEKGFMAPEDDAYVARGFTSLTHKNRLGGVGVKPLYPWDGDLLFEEEGVANTQELRGALRLCKDAGIKPVVCVMPITDAYLMSFKHNYERIGELFASVAAEFDAQFIDLNYSKMLRATLKDTHFTDNRHLNGDGANIVSEFLGDVLAWNAPDDAFYDTFEQLASSIDRVGGVSLRYSHSRGAFGVEAYCTYGIGVLPEFRFFIGPQGAAEKDMRMVRDYAPGNKLALEDLEPGYYRVAVDARDRNHPERERDSFAVMTVRVRARDKMR